MSPVGDGRHYVRAVEAAWSKLTGRPVVVSPREFEAIEGWRRRGIPLAVVLEVISAAGKRRVGRAPHALTGLTHAVNEAWGTVASGRAAPPATDVLPVRSDATRALTDALARVPESERLHALLASVLAEEARGAEGQRLDAALDGSLPGAVPDDLLRRLTDDTERALKDFRVRMSSEEFHRMFARALADRIRAELGLPRLALTQASRLAD